jgi:CDP-paratose 2-epimerase
LARLGSDLNLRWIQAQGEVHFLQEDIRNPLALEKVVRDWKPDVIFHLAGQVAMTISIATPREDFEINAGGTLNLLEAVRQHSTEAIVIYSSTNKVYGDLEQYHYRETATRYECVEWPNGFDETVPLSFHSPYGCSKGAADQYVLDYARMYGLRTVVFRHSSMYGGRQFATYDQGWVGWFCQKTIETKNEVLKDPFTISGTGKQVRDVLHADDMIRLYFSACEHIEAARGEAFNIGGGMENSLSLLELFAFLEELLDIRLAYAKAPRRQSDQKVFVADISKAKERIGWQPEIDKLGGIKRMLEWVVGLYGEKDIKKRYKVNE